MRGFLKPIAAIPLAIFAVTGAGGVASAQQSADSIINALKPTGNLLSGSTRGIKLGGGAAPHAPSAARPAARSHGRRLTPARGRNTRAHSRPRAIRRDDVTPAFGANTMRPVAGSVAYDPARGRHTFVCRRHQRPIRGSVACASMRGRRTLVR